MLSLNLNELHEMTLSHIFKKSKKQGLAKAIHNFNEKGEDCSESAAHHESMAKIPISCWQCTDTKDQCWIELFIYLFFESSYFLKDFNEGYKRCSSDSKKKIYLAWLAGLLGLWRWGRKKEQIAVRIINYITKKRNMPVSQNLGFLVIHKSFWGKDKDCTWRATMGKLPYVMVFNCQERNTMLQHSIFFSLFPLFIPLHSLKAQSMGVNGIQKNKKNMPIYCLSPVVFRTWTWEQIFKIDKR